MVWRMDIPVKRHEWANIEVKVGDRKLVGIDELPDPFPRAAFAEPAYQAPPRPTGTQRRYRYCMNSAHDAGITLHPQRAILLVAPDAHDFEPVSIADCWLFTSEPIGLKELPDYLRDVTDP